MAPINIDANLGVKDFVKGTKDMENALENVSDELETVGKSGDQDLEKLSDKLKEARKEAEKTRDGMRDSVGKGTKQAVGEANESLQELKDESKSTAKESAASFDGSAESIVDSFQEIAANAFAGFGPAGMLAGLAVAAGIGIATAEFQKSEEAAQKARERVVELSKAFMATRDLELPLENVIENLQNIASNSDDARVKFKDLQGAAQKVGIAAEDLAAAYSGAQKPLEGQLKMLRMLEKQTEANIQLQKNGDQEFSLGSSAKLAEIRKQIAALEEVKKETDAATEAEQIYLRTGAGEYQAKIEAIKGINDAYDDAVGSVTDFVDKETGILDVSKYIESMQARSKALADYQTDLATQGLTTEQKTALNDMGFEAANAWMQGYKSATPEQQKQMKDFLTEAAKDSSGSAKQVIDNAFKTPTEHRIDTAVNPIALEATKKAIADVVKDQKVKIEFEVTRKNIFGQDVP